MLDIGFSNYVDYTKVRSIHKLNSKPSKDTMRAAKRDKRFLDCSAGKSTRSLVITADNFVYGSSNSSDILVKRMRRLNLGGPILETKEKE